VLADVESMHEFLMIQLGPREREVFGLILLEESVTSLAREAV
jgi:hypothetical protein